MPTTATGRTYDTVHLATSGRASRMLVAAQAGDIIDRTKIPLIHEPGVTDDQGYTAQQRLAGSDKSVTGPHGETKDKEPEERPVTQDRQYIEIQAPGARVPSRILVAPVGHPEPTAEHVEHLRAIYDPRVARSAMDVYEGRAPVTKAAIIDAPPPPQAESEVETEVEPEERPAEEPEGAPEVHAEEAGQEVAAPVPEPQAQPSAPVAKKAAHPAKKAPHKRAN